MILSNKPCQVSRCKFRFKVSSSIAQLIDILASFHQFPVSSTEIPFIWDYELRVYKLELLGRAKRSLSRCLLLLDLLDRAITKILGR